VARPSATTWLARAEAADTDVLDERLVAARFDVSLHAGGEDASAVHVVAVGESLPGILLGGPLAEGCLAEVAGSAPAVGSIELLVEGGALAGGFVWAFELGDRAVYEVRPPAGRAVPVWRTLVGAARARRGRPVGVLAWAPLAARPAAERMVMGRG
jgi:hypothetical protein